MAYDALKKHKDDTNPYERLAGPDTSGPATAQVSRTPLALAPKTNDSGPTATGYVNFDSLYNANSGVAQREATQRADSAQAKAKAAQQGLAGAQNQYTQAAGAGSHAPTAEEQSFATYGQTGVDTGKKITDVGYNPATIWNTPQKGGGYQGKQVPVEHRDSEVITADAGSDDAERRSVAMGYPDNNGKRWGSVEEYDAAHRQPQGAPPEPVNRSASGQTVTEGQQEDLSPVLPPRKDANGNPIPGTGYPPYDPAKPGATQDAINANAKDPAAIQAALGAGASQKYTGPTALSSMDSYSQLAKDTAAAQDEINNPLTGMNQTDAALLGAAGRPRFDQLRSQYGHLGADLDRANINSSKQTQAAQARAQSDAGAYQKLLDEYGVRAGADEATRKANDEGNEKAMGDLQKQSDTDATRKYLEYLHPGAGNDFRNGLHKVAEYLNPIDWIARAAGGKTITQRSTDLFGGAGGADNPGNRSEAWGPGDADVFAAMTDADWDEFNALSIEGQYAWIAARRKKLRGGT